MEKKVKNSFEAIRAYCAEIKCTDCKFYDADRGCKNCCPAYWTDEFINHCLEITEKTFNKFIEEF